MALIKCPEPECVRQVSDKAQSCPECGFPVAAELKRIQELRLTPAGRAELAEREKQEKWEREKRERAERKAEAEREEAERAESLRIFKELRDKMGE